MSFTLEICTGSIQSALIAEKSGAHRIELCDNLSEGGTTPSYGMIKTCKSLLNIPIFPIIRPRGGDFVYSNEEFEVMKHDILCCAELGCEGVVFGILRNDGTVDTERCAELKKITGHMQVTFHRAFDRCNNQLKSLEDIISLGFDRVLTSGGKPYAEEAKPELKQLVDLAGDRIIVMPGSGVTSLNLLKILRETGAKEFHSTAKRKVGFSGKVTAIDNQDSLYPYETDPQQVAEMRRILDSHFNE